MIAHHPHQKKKQKKKQETQPLSQRNVQETGRVVVCISVSDLCVLLELKSCERRFVNVQRRGGEIPEKLLNSLMLFISVGTGGITGQRKTYCVSLIMLFISST